MSVCSYIVPMICKKNPSKLRKHTLSKVNGGERHNRAIERPKNTMFSAAMFCEICLRRRYPS
jgi:hypothetical protein